MDLSNHLTSLLEGIVSYQSAVTQTLVAMKENKDSSGSFSTIDAARLLSKRYGITKQQTLTDLLKAQNASDDEIKEMIEKLKE